jgi:pSer/pThr/pTyr-binding forkhead associated (FHA) protein
MGSSGQQTVPPSLTVVVEPPFEDRREYQFEATFRIGRTEDCAVCMKYEHVSRIHAEISYDGDVWCIRSGGN